MNDPAHHLRMLVFCVASLSTVALLLWMRARAEEAEEDDPDE